MGRSLSLVFGTVCYGIFFLTFLYLIGFLANFGVPKGIDSGATMTFGAALAIDIALIVLFGLQHSVMARPGFKAAWTRIVPASIERSVYVLLSSIALVLLFWLWVPLPQTIWLADAAWAQTLLWGLFGAGLLLVLLSTFVIDHFDLFGLRQVWLAFRGRPYTHLPFAVRSFYRFVRHPLYVGWFLTFWATPQMTLGHLLFAVGMSGYILVAVPYEERDLVRFLGADYEQYRQRVPKFLPRLRAPHAVVKGGPGPMAGSH